MTQEGKILLLTEQLADHADWRIGLFKSNTTITDATVLSDLTAADFSGYAAQAPAYGSVTYDGTNHEADSTLTELLFTHNGGATANDIYGAYLWDSVEGKLIDAVKFTASIPMSVAGDTIAIDQVAIFGDLP